MAQHIRTMTQNVRHNKMHNNLNNKLMSYMPQSIRTYLMKQEISGLTTALIIIAVFAFLLYAALIYLGVVSNPFSGLTAPKQNLQYFFF